MNLAVCPKDAVKKQSQPQGEEGSIEGLVYQHGWIAPDGQCKGLEESRVLWDVGLSSPSCDSEVQVRNSCHSLD